MLHLDEGPFYHGTKADLKQGDLLEPRYNRTKAPFWKN